MGFNLGKSITGALGGFLGGGPAGAIAGGLLGGLGGDDGGSAKVSFATIPQSPEAVEARKRIAQFAFGEPPDVPRRGVAPVEPIGEERQVARETALDLIKPQDFFALPEVQGIIQEAKRVGDLLSNRLGRMLQASGNLTSTTGRDVLGRTATDVQSRLAADLAPFAAEERGRRERLIPELERLGLTEELRKQGVTQAELDALFQQRTTESRQLETFTIPLLEKIIELQAGKQPIIKGQDPSTIAEFEPLIGPLLEAVLGRGGSGGDGLSTSLSRLTGGMTSPLTGTTF
ncbi:MAG: hypothetical protein V3U75_04060 [Methylococcaceae bacterium]